MICISADLLKTVTSLNETKGDSFKLSCLGHLKTFSLGSCLGELLSNSMHVDYSYQRKTHCAFKIIAGGKKDKKIGKLTGRPVCIQIEHSLLIGILRSFPFSGTTSHKCIKS